MTEKAASPELARLRELVRASGRTQLEIAEAAGMQSPHLSRLLSGRKPGASVETFRRVLTAIGKRWADLDG